MRKSFIIVSLLLLNFFIFSCQPSQQNKKADRLTFTNNCESIRGWTLNQGYSIDYAFSGNYSNRVDPENPFGETFVEKYGKLTLKTLTKAKISGYAFYLDPTVDANVCLSIVQNDQNVFYMQKPITEMVKQPKQWTKFEFEIEMPKDIQPDALIKIYVWNPGKTPVFIDDYEIQFFE